MANIESHLTQELLEAFHRNQLSQEVMNHVLEHIAQCTYCATLFAESFDQERLIKAPPGFKESVLKKAKQTVVVKVSVQRNLNRKRQMFFYSLKVGAAMFGAIFIIFTSANTSSQSNHIMHDADTKIDTSLDFQFLDDLSTSMKSFSEQINKQMDHIVTKTEKESSKEDNHH